MGKCRRIHERMDREKKIKVAQYNKYHFLPHFVRSFFISYFLCVDFSVISLFFCWYFGAQLRCMPILVNGSWNLSFNTSL